MAATPSDRGGSGHAALDHSVHRRFDLQQFLGGDLSQFMEATLAQRAFGTGPKQVEDVD